MARPPRILVVDDEPHIRMVISHTLEDEGCEVAVAVDGVEALRTCEASPPDLLILDLNMPRLGGDGVLRVLDERGWRQFPILIVTAEHDAKSRFRGIVQEILPKPLDLDRLCRTVQRLLDGNGNSRS